MNGDNIIIYEHPLQERIRNFLRLEFLFARFETGCGSENVDLHHLALLSLFEIMESAARADLKLDILQELERQRQRMQIQPECYESLDSDLGERLQNAAANLQGIQQKFGQHLRENEWLMTLKQRSALPGATSPADFASYYFWQNTSVAERQEYLQQWAAALMPTQRAIALLLTILRHHIHVSDCTAVKGNFQESGAHTHIQLLRIGIDKSQCIIPEIAANKYQIHIRFVNVDFQHLRGEPIHKDVLFRMGRCSFEPLK